MRVFCVQVIVEARKANALGKRVGNGKKIGQKTELQTLRNRDRYQKVGKELQNSEGFKKLQIYRTEVDAVLSNNERLTDFFK